MAYTPINWQTGDTITAEKLNKMDNEWGYESTQLFSETVTTVAEQRGNVADLTYSQLIDADTITVTFDGTEYACPRIDSESIDSEDIYFYGGFSESGPDFTNCPFFIFSGDVNQLITQTAGTHTIAVVGDVLVTSSDFSVAVGKCLPILKVELGKTTFQEVVDAINEGFFVYGWDDGNGRMFYALSTAENTGSSKYYLYALTKQSGAPAPTTETFVASSPTAPLHAN